MSDDIVEFCRRLRPRLIGSLSLLLGDDAAAEDAAQEALARAWDRWDRVREMCNPQGWTYRVAVSPGPGGVGWPPDVTVRNGAPGAAWR